MGLPNVMNTGRSGMMAAKAAISTTGHNITNANTEGYSRQRVEFSSETPRNGAGTKAVIGDGVKISRVGRINDEYVEKQIRNSGRDLANLEEKDLVLKQTEDIFNEMNGDGINRLMSKFFNEFRKLANEPDNEAIRQSVRESSQAMINDFHRVRAEVDQVREHIDSRIEGYVREANAAAEEVKELNQRIRLAEASGASPNDLLDKRDMAVKKLATLVEISTHKDKDGNVNIDIKGVGPLVTGPMAEKFSVFRSPADDQGKPENAYDIKTSGSAQSVITHSIKGGKLGGLVEHRDQMLSTVLNRLDELAYQVSDAVNSVHRVGFTRDGMQGVNYFKTLDTKERASEYIGLSDEVRGSVNNIAAAAMPDSPSDNRIAQAIAGLQDLKIMGNGSASADSFYNSIVSDIGVASARNKSSINQQHDIQTQLNKIREQISGVSIDEETTNLLQFHHAFDASAKVIQVADEMMKTVLELKRN